MIPRRDFLATGLAAGAGLCLAPAEAAAPRPAGDAIHVALIGAGDQGRVLINAGLLIPSLRFRAVCDIWRYRSRSARFFLETYNQPVNEYADYREMLDKEKDLHAVLVATPDFLHAEQVNACLKAGLHVYCEKMMSNSLEGARSMVRTMRETGKLLQIGYQRRSNPRYLHAYQNLLLKAKLPGRMTHAQTQWAHAVSEDLGWPKKQAMREDALQQHGYANMHELRNWRFYKKFGGGPVADFGSQQLDVCRWFLGATPRSVMAAGGVDYYSEHQWYDNVMAILEYDTPAGKLRGSCQVLTTTNAGNNGSFEQLMGTEGTIRLSENPKWTKIFREANAPDWAEWVRQNLLLKEDLPAAGKKEDVSKPEDPNEVHVRETGQVTLYDIPVTLDKPSHQPHLENFLDAVRGKARLNCPADEALPTEVIVHKINEAIQARKAIELKAEAFAV